MAFTSAPLSGLTSPGIIPTRRTDSVRSRSSQISAAYASVERPRVATCTNSLYDVLGIQTSASCQEIKQAYRRLARVSHPDVASSGADEFIKIHSAYTTLSDPEQRASYDRSMLAAATSYRYSSGSTKTTPFMNRRWETDQCW